MTTITTTNSTMQAPFDGPGASGGGMGRSRPAESAPDSSSDEAHAESGRSAAEPRLARA
jgi:hypothetical protein